MSWTKRGLLVGPRPELAWSRHFAMSPTPLALGPGVLRIYYGTTDDNLVGRTAHADVSPEDPARVLGYSRVPDLEPGAAGSFDDAGAIPQCVAGEILFYAGFRRRDDIPYETYLGAAFAGDDGSFRKSGGPVLPPRTGACHFRAGAFVLPESGGYRMWYLEGTGWHADPAGKRVPTYEMRCLTSSDPLRWEGPGIPCLVPDPSRGETGFSRPWVVREGPSYRMWYSVRGRTTAGDVRYTRIETARSADGLRWVREIAAPEIGVSASGWDSEMVCYPAFHRAGPIEHLFYAGNGNGRAGFGFAARRSV